MIKKPRFQSKLKKVLLVSLLLALIVPVFSLPVFAATDTVDIAGPIVDVFTNYIQPQVEKLVDYVVLPLIDVYILIRLIISIVSSVHNYRRAGELDWTHSGILLLTLIFTMTVSIWMWGVIHWGSPA